MTPAPAARAPLSLCDLTLAELTGWVTRSGQPAYRAKQVFHSLYQKGTADPAAMSDLPKELRDLLAKEFPAPPLAVAHHQESADGTSKWLFRLADGQFVESVLIPVERHARGEASSRRTVCLSTQVGCAYGCAFCASGMDGFQRNLSAGEIVEEVLAVQRDAGRVTHIVFMGMGEPLANYDNLLKAIRVLNDPEGLKVGARKITISTVGLVPMIERLSKEGIQVELSISLHAPNDELRGQIMPVNRRYPLAELIKACRAYVKATKRLITFEYILMEGVNDAPAQARELAVLLKGLPCKVNLIPCHPIPGSPFTRPPMKRMLAFEGALREKRIPCTLRRSRGLDIDGACGQLRLRHEAGVVKS